MTLDKLRDRLPSREELREAKLEDLIRSQEVMRRAQQRPIDAPWTIGLEREFYVTDAEGHPAVIPAEMFKRAEGFGEAELGPSQFEYVSPVWTVTSLAQLHENIRDGERQVHDLAETFNLRIVPIGAIPNLEPADAIRNLKKPRYRLIQDVETALRDPGQRTLDGRDYSRVIGQFINATHLNFSVHPDDADYLFQAMFEVEAYATAIGGNARVLAGKDSRYNDLRGALWQHYFDMRDSTGREHGDDSGLGIPARIPQSIEEHVQDLINHPGYVLRKDGEAATIGLSYHIARAKFYPEAVVFEGRGPSVQPTAEEETALTAFRMGMIEYRRQNGWPPSMSRDAVAHNYKEAMRDGLDGMFMGRSGMLVPARELIRSELDLATEALKTRFDHDEVDHYMGIMYERINRMVTPSGTFVKQVEKHGTRGALLHMAENARQDTPYLRAA